MEEEFENPEVRDLEKIIYIENQLSLMNEEIRINRIEIEFLKQQLRLLNSYNKTTIF